MSNFLNTFNNNNNNNSNKCEMKILTLAFTQISKTGLVPGYAYPSPFPFALFIKAVPM